MTDLLSERKNAVFTVPRHVSYLLCRILTLRSYPEIGRRTGNRDHSTIVHGVHKYRWLSDLLRAELKQTDILSVWVSRAHDLVMERGWGARVK
jgi:chromosomal replication initiation ATPase DnaA